MLRNTFCHVPGIGAKTEQNIWSSGVLTWENALELDRPKTGALGRGRAPAVRFHLEQSLERFQAGDARYFCGLLPSDQQWRLFPDFGHSVAYLDIETTGSGGFDDHITTIALYDGKDIFHYVHGDNLSKFRDDIRRYDLLVTYNGKSFDVPFIRRDLNIPMDQAHIDLMHVLRSLGYRGGLKGCERRLGIDRKDLDGVDGFFAVLLWREYTRTRNPVALETLLAYNILDAVNLHTLMVMAYNLKVALTPFSNTHAMTLPAEPCIPFQPDKKLIDRLKDQIPVYSHGFSRY